MTGGGGSIVPPPLSHQKHTEAAMAQQITTDYPHPWTRALDARPPLGIPVRLRATEEHALPGYFVLHVDGLFYRLDRPVIVELAHAYWVSVH